MHKSSWDKMRDFRDKYLADRRDQAMSILDLGSLDVSQNFTYGDLFDQAPWRYTGMDLAEGKNVDIVLSDPYDWRAEVADESVDVLISGQALEHVEYFWILMLEVYRVLKPGGICCIIAPSGGIEHRYPVDCWRFYPDGLTALAKFAQLTPVEAYTQWEPVGYSEDNSDIWQDSVLIATKPELPAALASERREINEQQHKVMSIGLKDIAVRETPPVAGYEISDKMPDERLEAMRQQARKDHLVPHEAYEQLLDAYRQRTSAYDKTKAAYDQVKAAYDQVKAAYDQVQAVPTTPPEDDL